MNRRQGPLHTRMRFLLWFWGHFCILTSVVEFFYSQGNNIKMTLKLIKNALSVMHRLWYLSFSNFVFGRVALCIKEPLHIMHFFNEFYGFEVIFYLLTLAAEFFYSQSKQSKMTPKPVTLKPIQKNMLCLMGLRMNIH